ncbi:hypothetical protein A2774_03470 [Candidatus Roizmanbacteria bacterium RIFCSPHIGHO2_01_FULL_39_12c]|uniref:Calcineurin-like phosphoesterase domain-containing protein n=1 Tax=Candidatus Roizmanbacteria bacterium RIFCSPHIGHO2_01_FULL_39_12c TaxID=1802031 RepID=A0A1F7G8X7_9BACT|nr:MAG: hypothetical protein A2774_03470 [Candidatus Roizmanbacteria bacterium RIFCSPHIGHO2_01_FULL_39_12c]OGK47839.1 MAG: hypothetical protein A2963_03225 [Candidatus Roizmanbacteria bacterium RIFCSPLOWO2_01_FULL_40_13]
MKILVFSDTHLTDKFEENKFNLLKKIISASDRVIINGDFWDGQLTTFDKFISSGWNKLFPLLRSKKTIYLYGNHDLKSFSDSRTSLFSVIQTDIYSLKLNEKTLVFQHGNKLLPLIDEKLPRWLTKYTTLVAGFLLVNLPPLRYLLKTAGQKMKDKVKKIYKNGEIVVCGHSHWVDFDLNNQYINTGYIENGVAKYLLIRNNRLLAQEENYL